MQLLFSVFRDSFVIWSRNFTLVYIFFLLIGVSSLVIAPLGLASFDARSLSLIVLLELIFSAFMAGLFYMVTCASTRYLENRSTPAVGAKGSQSVTVFSSFAAFRDFLPGIGAFFVPVAVGYAIQFGVLAALLWWIRPMWQQVLPLMQRLGNDLMAGASQDAVIHSLTLSQKASLGQLGLAIVVIMLIYSVFSTVVMLWPVFTVMYEDNPFKAYARSALQFLRDPFRLVALSLTLFLIKLLLTMFTMMDGMFFEILGRLSLMLLEIYTIVTLFVYAYHAVGKPVLSPDESDTSSSSDMSEKPPFV